MLPLIFVLVAASAQTASPTQPPVRCDYDHHALDLAFKAFDQDMKGGWRALAKQQGCEDTAADLLRQYRQRSLSIIPLLSWHEAQIRAFIGESKEAISLMEQSRQPKSGDLFGWNPYVDATIAFLRNDKNRFLEAWNRLKRLNKPVDWSAEWPQNATVVAGLWNCFGKPYKVAYGSACRQVINSHSASPVSLPRNP